MLIGPTSGLLPGPHLLKPSQSDSADGLTWDITRYMISLRMREFRSSLPLMNKVEELRGARLHRSQLHSLIATLDRKIHQLEDMRMALLASRIAPFRCNPPGDVPAPLISAATQAGPVQKLDRGPRPRDERLESILCELRRLQRERRERVEELARVNESVEIMESAISDHPIESLGDIRTKLNLLAEFVAQGVEIEANHLVEALDEIATALSYELDDHEPQALAD